MAKTMKDLFLSSDKNTKKEKGSVRLNQELTGLRTTFYKNIPLVYGSDVGRITTQTTPMLNNIKTSANGEEGSGGLVGQGLAKLTGGKISSLDEGIVAVNTKLGIPQKLNPSKVADQLSLPSDQRMDDLDTIREGANGTGLGSMLSKTGGGTPTQIGSSLLGQGIGVVKKKTRNALLGDRTSVGEVEPPNNRSNFFSDVKKYQDTIEREDGIPKELYEEIGIENSFGIPHSITLDSTRNFSRKGISDRKPGWPMHGEQSAGYYKESKGYKRFGKDVKDRTLYGKDNEYATNAVKVKIEVESGEPVSFPLAVISGISETFTPSWSSSKMIGSPFSHHRYDGIDRSVSFNLKLYSTHPDDHIEMWKRLEKLAKLVYPLKYSGLAGVITPPITKLTIGGMYHQKYGFISSLSYSVDEAGGWDTGFDDAEMSIIGGSRLIKSAGPNWILPKVIDVSISYNFIESRQDVEDEQLYSFEPVR